MSPSLRYSEKAYPAAFEPVRGFGHGSSTTDRPPASSYSPGIGLGRPGRRLERLESCPVILLGIPRPVEAIEQPGRHVSRATRMSIPDITAMIWLQQMPPSQAPLRASAVQARVCEPRSSVAEGSGAHRRAPIRATGGSCQQSGRPRNHRRDLWAATTPPIPAIHPAVSGRRSEQPPT